MKRTTIEAKDQQMVVPAGRRGFLRRAGATALAAGVMTASVAAPKVARAVPAPYVNGIVEIEMASEAGKDLAELCKLTAMYGEWVRVNQDIIQAKCPELALELSDFAETMAVSANSVSRAGGFEVNDKYVAQYGQLVLSMREAA